MEITVNHVHADTVGSALLATDASALIAWQDSYKPYGGPINNTAAPTGTASNHLRFAGKHYDGATGLSYMGARYYSPAIGRFISPDPVAFQIDNVHSFNRYAYANNNPTKFTDPNGQYAELAIEAISVAMGYNSAKNNYQNGKYWAAAADGIGVLADVALMAVPGVPGGFGLGIKASREGVEAAGKSIGNWKSVKQFGHTFSEHGAGIKNTERLVDRARSTGTPQGQWLNNEKAAEFLSGLKIDGPATVRIPDGLGQIVKADGSISKTGWATVVPRSDGLRTAYPIPAP